MTWIIIISSGISTFISRFSFFFLADKFVLPKWVVSLLSYVPTAVLSSIIISNVMLDNSGSIFIIFNEKLYASVVAILISLIFNNIFLTILVGMLSMWFLNHII
mgnify:CR=1 FL=1